MERYSDQQEDEYVDCACLWGWGQVLVDVRYAELRPPYSKASKTNGTWFLNFTLGTNLS